MSVHLTNAGSSTPRRDAWRAAEEWFFGRSPMSVVESADAVFQPVDYGKHGERRHQQHRGNRRCRREIMFLELIDDERRNNLGPAGKIARHKDNRAVFADGPRKSECETGE